MAHAKPVIKINSQAIRIDQVLAIARGQARIALDESPAFQKSLQASVDLLDKLMADGRVIYGVTTGFGEFKTIPLEPDQLQTAQRNILLSHATGVGDNADPDDPANYFSIEIVRAALIIRLNAFLRGNSGVRTEMLECLLAMINRGIVFEPLVGELFRSQLVMHAAPRNGDFVTPTLVGAEEYDFAERDLRYSRPLFHLLTNDREFADHNKGLLSEWLGTWTGRSLEAARKLQPLWSQPESKPPRFEDSLDAVKGRFAGILSDINLESVVTQTLRNVRNAYWDLSYAINNLKAQQESLALSRQSLKDNQKRVEIGTMAPIDIVQAQAEVASNEQGVIIADANIKTAQDNLRTLMERHGI